MRLAVAVASLALVLSRPAAAQAPPGRDFWYGMGRFVELFDPAGFTKTPPDLSGTYEVQGLNHPDDTSSAYHTTLTVKRKKTIETPQGAKLTVYDIRYNWDDPVDGVAVFIGHRLYLGYGGKDFALAVGAPLALVDDEVEALRRDQALQAEASRRSTGGTMYYQKDGPWFSVYVDDGWAVHFQHEDWDGSSFYAFWVNPKGLVGQEFFDDLDPWGEGTFDSHGMFLKKGKEVDGIGDVYGGTLRVTADGMNFQVTQSDDAHGEGDNASHGTAFQLEDGTVVWLIGGGDGSGAGYYDVANGTLSGQWWTRGSDAAGTETLTPAPAIVTRNPTLFGGK